MKKFLSALLCAALAALAICGFAACAPAADPEKVNLAAITGEQVLPGSEYDYFVVPEPAASAKVKATSSSPNGLKIVGNLQQLYGGEEGYPQAVVVIRKNFGNEVIGTGVSSFYNALKNSTEWLQADTTEISTVVDAVKANLTEGMSPTFSDKNLTKQVISNCGVRLDKNASETKEETKSFLTALKAVQPNIKDNPADTFFWTGVVAEAESTVKEINVYAPDGAPALALAGLMSGEVNCEGVADMINYHIVDASTIQTYVTGDNPTADICILPVNVAANLLGNGEKYTMLGTVTHGNLYILSAKNGEQITAENLSDLRGKTVGVVNLAAVPGLTLKLILNKYGIEYTEPSQS